MPLTKALSNTPLSERDARLLLSRVSRVIQAWRNASNPALVIEAGKAQKPAFPANDLERTAAVYAALVDARQPLDARAIAATFRPQRGWRHWRRRQSDRS